MSKRTFSEGLLRTDPKFRVLCEAFAACRTAKEVAAFLRDLGTLSELWAWSERFEVARQLATGRTYREVSKKTGASTTTITRVASFLNGDEGGYRKALNLDHSHVASHGHRHGTLSLAGRGRR